MKIPETAGDFLPWVLGILALVATYVFGRPRLRRDNSGAYLQEAQDSEQATLMRDLREEKNKANERADMAFAQLLAAREDADKVRQLLVDEITAMKLRGSARDAKVERQRKQLGALASIVATSRPELAPLIEQSGFVDFDDSGGQSKERKGT